MDKPSLVILPGWGGSAATWKPFTNIASRTLDVTVIDLPCFGDTPCPKDVWGVGEYATFVEKKIRELSDINGQTSKVTLLGHSFGGQVAVRLVADHPELFSGLILVGAAAIRPWHPLRRLFFWCIAKTGKIIFSLPFVEKGSTFARELLYRAVGSRDYSTSSGIKRDIFKKIMRENLRSTLQHIRIPTTVIWGTRDAYIPLRYGKKIARLIPGAKLVTISDGRHGLHLQDPELLYTHIVNFMS